MENISNNIEVISGIVHNLKIDNTMADIFFQPADREGMATTGTLAAAMGLSGIAAGMASASIEETKEPICRASFELDGKRINALLWSWPFKEGDFVQVVVEPFGDDYIGFAVIDPGVRVVVLYPHVTAGRNAHWSRVIKIIMLMTVGFSLLGSAIFLYLYFSSEKTDIRILFYMIGGVVIGSLLIFGTIGYRIGNRFTPFVKMAGRIFTALGWKDVTNIDLRKITKAKKKETDPPAMGDSYFRY